MLFNLLSYLRFDLFIYFLQREISVLLRIGNFVGNSYKIVLIATFFDLGFPKPKIHH